MSKELAYNCGSAKLDALQGFTSIYSRGCYMHACSAYARACAFDATGLRMHPPLPKGQLSLHPVISDSLVMSTVARARWTDVFDYRAETDRSTTVADIAELQVKYMLPKPKNLKKVSAYDS